MQKLDIYVKGDSGNEYVKLDQYDDETVEVTQNIKDFKDVSKVLTDYTNQFRVPATKTNNKFFKHYYNSDIENGFDARFRVDATLKINGIDWKEGQIRLTGVDMKNGSPESYVVTFFGRVVSLNNILGNDNLEDLPYLDVFNHEISFTLVKDYFQYGADVVYDLDGNPTGLTDFTLAQRDKGERPDMCYPFISSENRYYVDGNDSQPDIDKTRNLHIKPADVGNVDEYHGLLYTDLKPAIKAIHILKAMESKYGIVFSEDFLSFSNQVTDELYLWCSRESGLVTKGIEETNKTIKISEFSFSSGQEVRSGSSLENLTTDRVRSGGGKTSEVYFTCKTDIDVTGTGSYKIKAYNNSTNVIYYEQELTNSASNISFDLSRPTGFGAYDIPLVIEISTVGGITHAGLSNIEITKKDRSINNVVTETDAFYSDISQQAIGSGINFRQAAIPKMKCIDFLKDFFKLFNLVAYVEDGVIVINTLDKFYKDKESIDVSDYIDSSKSKINRADIYSEIEYKYSNPKTVFAIKSNETTGDEYGNEVFSSDETTSFDGGKYDVKVKFGHMVYENLIDINQDKYTTLTWGYSVNESFSPTIENPLLFFVKRSSFAAFNDTYYMTDGTVNSALDSFKTCWSPVNYYYNYEKGVDSSINFGSEISATFSVLNSSLFENYYSNYILNLYDRKTRTMFVEMNLPVGLMLRIGMSNALRVNGKEYLIDKLTTNMQSGKTKAILVTNNYTDKIIGDNEIIGTSSDGVTQSFFAYRRSDAKSSEALACIAPLILGYSILIGEDDKTYLRISYDEIVPLSFSFNYFIRVSGYTHHIIEVDSDGLILNKTNCL